MQVQWQRFGGYECSSRGDARFSAFTAVLPDGRTIEQWYQCDIKGYQPGSTNWRLGKGKPPLSNIPHDVLFTSYVSLWRIWAINNLPLMEELLAAVKLHGHLSDRFATTPINQAHALAVILSEWTT